MIIKQEKINKKNTRNIGDINVTLDEYDEVVDKETFLDKIDRSAHIFINEEFS